MCNFSIQDFPSLRQWFCPFADHHPFLRPIVHFVTGSFPLPLACPALPRSTAPGCSFTPLPPLPRSSSFLGFCILYFLVFRISLHSLPPKPGSLGFLGFEGSQLSNFLFGGILDDHWSTSTQIRSDLLNWNWNILTTCGIITCQLLQDMQRELK